MENNSFSYNNPILNSDKNRDKDKQIEAKVGLFEPIITPIDNRIREINNIIQSNSHSRKTGLLLSIPCGLLLINQYFLNYFKINIFVIIIIWILFILGVLVLVSSDSTLSKKEKEELEKRKKSYLDLFNINESKTYFDNLVEINVDNLGAYYSLVKNHTRYSYNLTAITGFVGFLLICAGLVIGYFKEPKTLTYISISVGLIIDFISGIFFYLYNKTVIQLKEYHDSLLDVQNILLSFKLVENTEEVNIKNEMVKEMISALNKGKK